MRKLSFNHRILILLGSFLLALAGAMLIEPIPQDPRYHAFADTRPGLGIANFGDVVSNTGFAAVGVWGLWLVLVRLRSGAFSSHADAWPYLVFFAGVAFVSLGSAYYHMAPDNDRLFWDRLPMTVGFMAFFAALIADRIHRTLATRYLLPVLMAAGFLSLLYWNWTEAQGQGDLRFYALVQFFPIIALPLVLWMFPQARYTAGHYLFWVIIWYAAAKGLEYFDFEILTLLGNTISGHSLKHLAAAVSALVVGRMISVNTMRRQR